MKLDTFISNYLNKQMQKRITNKIRLYTFHHSNDRVINWNPPKNSPP